MSIQCSKCSYEMSGYEFTGYIGSKLAGPLATALCEIWKLTLTRSPFSDAINGLMIGTANQLQIPCAKCKKYKSWLPVTEISSIPQEQKEKGQENVL